MANLKRDKKAHSGSTKKSREDVSGVPSLDKFGVVQIRWGYFHIASLACSLNSQNALKKFGVYFMSSKARLIVYRLGLETVQNDLKPSLAHFFLKAAKPRFLVLIIMFQAG